LRRNLERREGGRAVSPRSNSRFQVALFLLASLTFLLPPIVHAYEVIAPIWILNGSRALAGEIGISYDEKAVNISEVVGVSPWNTFPIYVGSRLDKVVFYRFANTTADYNSTVAIVKFVTSLAEINVTLYIRAADGSGNDVYKDVRNLVLTAVPTTKPRRIVPPTTTTIATTPPSERGFNVVLIAVIALVALASIASIMLLARFRVLGGAESPPYTLLGDLAPMVVSKADKIFSREDLERILHPSKLVYISRRSGGGQFRVFYRGGKYYLVNLSAKNVTCVNGVPAVQPVELKNGDEIEVGEARIRFYYGRYA